ncbi:hypothetical protein GCM10025767_02050 [Thalassotalea piscium]
MIKINALYLTVFPVYKIDHLINETGITFTNVTVQKAHNNSIRKIKKKSVQLSKKSA